MLSLVRVALLLAHLACRARANAPPPLLVVGSLNADMIIEVEGADGSGKPLRLVRGPVEFDGKPLETTRAPQASEHTETVLMEMGIEWDKIEQWKASGAIA